MARVLLVDDDPGTLDTLGRVLRLARHDFAAAATGSEALRVAKTFDPDVAAIDLCLPDSSGIDITRRLLQGLPHISCMIITGYWSREDMLEGIRAGACDWLDKPLFGEELLEAIRRALTGRRRQPAVVEDDGGFEPHAHIRLAEASIKFLGSKKDYRKLASIGRNVGHSGGCLRNWCRTAHIAPRQFRDFTRGLRAIHKLTQKDALDGDLLEIVDDRTLAKFRVKSGGNTTHLPETVDLFLSNQQFVSDAEFIEAVRALVQRTN